MKKPRKKAVKAGMLGVGLDNDDEITRVTRGRNFLLVSGSQETHERMADHMRQVNDVLRQRRRRLEDVTPKELGEIVSRVLEKS